MILSQIFVSHLIFFQVLSKKFYLIFESRFFNAVLGYVGYISVSWGSSEEFIHWAHRSVF